MHYIFLGENNYSLVLEYADGGTLENYLRKNATTFKWESQLKFAREIASAILCLHDHNIIHRDLVSLKFKSYFHLFSCQSCNLINHFYLAS